MITGRSWELGGLPRPRPFGRGAALTAAGVAGLVVAGLVPRFSGSLARPVLFLASLQEAHLNAVDQSRIVAGYYEGLLNVQQIQTPLWQLGPGRERPWPPIDHTAAWHYTGDFFDSELRPNVTTPWGTSVIQTNRWGFRDKDYSLDKPPGTYRIALLGGSEVMGTGVNNPQIFEALLEDRLNRQPVGDRYAHFEILNFGVFGHFAVQRWMMLDRKALAFKPDAVLYVGHNVDGAGTVNFLATSVHYGKLVPYPYLRDLLARMQVDSSVPLELAKKRLAPYADSLLAWAYRNVVEECRARGIVPVWMFLPSVYEDGPAPPDRPEVRLARAAGFVVIDLSGSYDGRDPADLRVSAWDPHPNAVAHRIIAARLYDRLRTPGMARILGLVADSTESGRANGAPRAATRP
jgi:hypothetical protein